MPGTCSITDHYFSCGDWFTDAGYQLQCNWAPKGQEACTISPMPGIYCIDVYAGTPCPGSWNGPF